MKNFKLTLFILFTAVMFSCGGNKGSEMIEPLTLSKYKLSLWDGSWEVRVQSDTINVLSGNGDYRVVFDNRWESSKGKIDSVDDYVNVYVYGDKIIAKRTELPEDGFLVSYYVIDAKGEKVYFDLETRYYTGGL